MKHTISSNRSKLSSVYRNQDSLLRALFDRAGDPRKVLCVALDFSKRKHVALCCDGNGDILKAPFSVENSTDGVAFLVEQINASARRRKIPTSNIFIGGEDEPSYAVNFMGTLRSHNFLLVRVNAFEAKENRENLLASTDALDLSGIAKTLLSRRARLAAPSPGPAKANTASNDIYYQIRELTRSRRSLVRQQTACSNRIHALVDQLFPGFLDATKSGITPFSLASIALMKQRFSAPEIARRSPRSLTSFLRRLHLRNADELAPRLIALAAAALPPLPERIAALQQTLAATVSLLECLKQNAAQLRASAAILLASTPYSLLLSIRGIGFTLASGMAGELGDPRRLSSLECLCCFAGIVPSTFQTGGPDSPPVQGHTAARCNHILKDWTVQSAQKIHLFGPPELKDRITRWNANGQHGIFAGARRYLRLLRSLVLNGVPYYEPAARSRSATMEERTAGTLAAWAILARKWSTISGGLALITNEATPIGYWRRIVMESRSLDLPLTA